MTTSFKVKPLGNDPIQLKIMEGDTVVEDRIVKLGEYLDVELPEGRQLILQAAQSLAQK